MRSEVWFVVLLVLLVGCGGAAASEPLPTLTAASQLVALNIEPSPSPSATPTPTANPIPTLAPPPTPTPIPTITHTHTPTITPTPTWTATPSLTPTLAACTRRLEGDDLLTIVTRTYGLSRDYQPTDLMLLSDYLPVSITQGYPTQVRQVIIEPLVQMIHDMEAAGLEPFIISGYRSYSAQAIAYQKWLTTYPENAPILSAPPGHSEHQLGTTVDFGSPELAGIVGQEDIEFHTYFYQTSEGQWLLNYAHQYGFTLSYPREAFALTGFYYEPWHYRYIGVEMASYLKEVGLSLTEYQLLNFPPPCLP
ncbi:MAG: M15 family metallopeptidase [Anaerolineae bacterium]|nr:M15 family metallopeptidase [Anaerolineae bacterium]